MEEILSAAPMHDLRKIGIPDRILQKEGPLDPEERSVMQTHTTIGARLLEGSQVPFIDMGTRITAGHCEGWGDGSGYPAGCQGGSIPLEAHPDGPEQGASGPAAGP